MDHITEQCKAELYSVVKGQYIKLCLGGEGVKIAF